MNVKKIIMSLAMIIAATVTASAQDTANKTKDLDSLYAQKLLKTGDKAPDFILPMPNNYKVQLADFKGQYVLLDFWASWCPDCRKDIPTVKSMYERFGKKVVFIGVSFDVDRDRWTKCITDNGMQWRQVSEMKKMRDSKTAKDFGVQWIPSMTLIGPDGKVVLSTVVVERMEQTLEKISN